MGRLLTRRRDNNRYVCKLSRIDSQIMQVGFPEVNVKERMKWAQCNEARAGGLLKTAIPYSHLDGRQGRLIPMRCGGNEVTVSG